MTSVFGVKECFLASPPWKAVMMKHYNPSISLERHELIEEFVAHFMDLPSILHNAYRLRHVVLKMQPQGWAEVVAVLERVSDKRRRLDDWYQRWVTLVGPPSEKPSHLAPDNLLYPIIYAYPDPSIASTFCSYYTYKIVIHSILNATHVPSGHSAYLSYYVDQICKSVEYNGHGVFGPYRMGYAMTVAFEAGNLQQRKWLNVWIERFSTIYASIPRRDVNAPRSVD